MRSGNSLLRSFAVSSVLAISSLMPAYAQSGGGPSGWNVLLNGNPNVLPLNMYQYVPGGVLSLVAQSQSSPVRWIVTTQGRNIPGGASTTTRNLFRIDPTQSPINIGIPKMVPARVYGSSVSYSAEWVNRLLVLHSPALESGTRYITVATPSGISTLQFVGNFHKGADDKPVLNVRTGDGANNSIITDSVIGLTVPQVVGFFPFWKLDAQGLEATALGLNGFGALDWPTWTNVSRYSWEKWTARTPYSLLSAAISNERPYVEPTTHQISLTDSLGSMSSTYTIRWHMPLENAEIISSEDVPGAVTTNFQWDKTDYRYLESPKATCKQFTGIGFINGSLALLGASSLNSNPVIDVRIKIVLVALGILVNSFQPEDQTLGTSWTEMWNLAHPGIPIADSQAFKLSMNVGTIDLRDTYKCDSYSASGYEKKENVCKQVFKSWDWQPVFTPISTGSPTP